MDYVIEFNPANGRYQQVFFQRLEGNVRLDTEVVALVSRNYSDAVVEAEQNDLVTGYPFVLDMDDLVIDEMAQYYGEDIDVGCEYDPKQEV